jgi:hypothetical protein
MKKSHEIQRLYRLYKEESGNQIVDMREFAAWMKKKGWEMPIPIDPLDLLAKQCAAAVREETRRDETTGRPYKANLAFSPDGSPQGMLWADVDEAPKKIVHKCLIQRRDQMVGDAYQLTLIQDHWNNIHPDEEPIQIPLDFQPDVDWKKNGGDEQASAA